MPAFQMSLLGGFELRGNGRVVRLPTRKAEALLAYLALAPQRGYARDALTALLWGEASDQSARASLRQTLFLIGKAFDPTPIETEGRTVALTPGALDVDVLAFERFSATQTAAELERAVALYRGDLLDGIAVNEAPFEEWLRAERERLRERIIEVLGRLVTFHRQQGSADRAIQAALRLAAMDPLEEDVHRVLMSLYADSGRRAAALRQYQSCVEVLRRELGAEPAAATRSLYRDLLQRDPTESRSHPAERGRERFVSTVSEAAVPYLDPSSPIGRNAELLRLRQALDEAQQGRGRVSIVVGEAGIGKTTLTSSFAAAAAAHGSWVMTGRSYESEQVFPFAPWVDAFQTSGLLTGEVLERLDPRWRAELTRLFPEVHAEGLPAPSDDSRRLLESVLRLLMCLATARPVVLILEDMHWADEMSTRLLSFVGRRLQGHAVLVVATAREEELPDASALRGAINELRAGDQFDEIALGPLSVSDTAVLVRSQVRSDTGDDVVGRLEAQIWRMSEGNPFVALETLRAFGEGNVPLASTGSLTMPERVREVIARRLERLTARGRELAAVAAVIGREVDFQLVARASGMGEREAAEAVEELVRRRILHASGAGFDFAHDYIRQATYARILAPQRTVLHARIAQALEEMYGSESSPHYAALGQHCEQGGLWDKAVTYLGKAGAQAAELSAYREAAQTFERALALLERLSGVWNAATSRPPSHGPGIESIELRLMLRNALLPLGDEARIVVCLREAQHRAEHLGDRSRQARILSYLCRHLLRVNEYPASLEAGRRALTAAAEIDDVDVPVGANFYLGMVLQFMGDLPKATDHLRETLRLVERRERERCGLPYLPAVFARAILAWSLADLGDFDAAFTRAREAIELAEAVDHPWDRLMAYHYMGLVHLERGDRLEALPFLDRAARLCESVDVAAMHPHMTGYLGYARALTGELQEGTRLLEQAIAVSGPPQSWTQSRLLSFLAETKTLLGKPEQALDCAHRGLQLARERAERGYEAWALRALAEVLALSCTTEALARYREALGLAQTLGMLPLVAHCHQGLGELHLRAGMRREALRHATDAATAYRQLDMPVWRDRADARVKELS